VAQVRARAQKQRATRRTAAATGPHHQRRFVGACSVVANSPSSLAIKGTLPGSQTPFSFSFSTEKQSYHHPSSLPASHRSSRPSFDSFHLDHREGSSVLLPWFSQPELTSSGLHNKSWHCLPLLDGELQPLCRPSQVGWSIGYLKSSTS
jgi:hypothetical protein